MGMPNTIPLHCPLTYITLPYNHHSLCARAFPRSLQPWPSQSARRSNSTPARRCLCSVLGSTSPRTRSSLAKSPWRPATNTSTVLDTITTRLRWQTRFARQDIYITTKIYDPEHGTQATRTAVEDSLAQTKLDYFDLILLHSPLSGKEKRLEAYKVLLDFQGKGKIKSVGVSNYGVHHMEEIKQAGLRTPAVNQIELHPWCQQKDIVDYCEANGIVVQAYCPLVRGLRMSDATLVELAKQCSKIPAQVLVRWSLQKGFVPLPKSDTPSRIKENADVYNFELDETAMAKLDALDEGKAGACQWNPVDAP